MQLNRDPPEDVGALRAVAAVVARLRLLDRVVLDRLAAGFEVAEGAGP